MLSIGIATGLSQVDYVEDWKLTKLYSASDASRKEEVTLAKNDIPLELIAGFVT